MVHKLIAKKKHDKIQAEIIAKTTRQNPIKN